MDKWQPWFCKKKKWTRDISIFSDPPIIFQTKWRAENLPKQTTLMVLGEYRILAELWEPLPSYLFIYSLKS